MTTHPILTARFDADDCLIEADASLGALNARAGGTIGAPAAVPQLATVVRLARRLRIPVQRSVTIADGEIDLDCWVKASPGEGGVALALTTVRERGAWRAPAGSGGDVPPPPDADWTWRCDALLRLTHLPDAAHVPGFDGSAFIGQPLTRFFSLEPTAAGALPLIEAMGEGGDFDGQGASVRASGTRVTLAGHARRDTRGDFAGFVGGAYTVTDAQQIGGRAAFNTRLERILRRPLGVIVANADSINAAAEGPIDPHYADYAADIASAGRHLMALIDDLADIEAIERDDFTVAREAVDLADVAIRAAGLFAVRAANAGVTIDVPRGIALPATGEFRRALQVLVNLIGNAVRYSPRGSTVWVRLQRDGDRALVIVADTGKGISTADQARIFEKFERVDTSEPGGSGLGLYIARRLARAMGGDLTVDSAPGEGARFILSLPAA